MSSALSKGSIFFARKLSCRAPSPRAHFDARRISKDLASVLAFGLVFLIFSNASTLAAEFQCRYVKKAAQCRVNFNGSGMERKVGKTRSAFRTGDCSVGDIAASGMTTSERLSQR